MGKTLRMLFLSGLCLMGGAALIRSWAQEEVGRMGYYQSAAREESLEREQKVEKEERTAAPPKALAVSGEPNSLYALSAVLMDGETGRVLFEKEGGVKRPMASTTKVMTCILALENARGDETVKVSARAAAQPDVQLNMIEGQEFRLEDLLYSLMLKSHNDTAVAIAEHLGGTVEGFAKMMNEKAVELGCTDTHFVTPNGLDDEDGGGVHSTTARDLAQIMSYAIRNETFLTITQTREYSFWDMAHEHQYQVTNGNAFLDMMEGAISGKTGFTADAGYCYVGALKRDDRTFVVALLGCGWPNNKSYKWKDTRALMEYGLQNYQYRELWQEPKLSPMTVENSVPPKGELTGESQVTLVCEHEPEDEKIRLLLGSEEKVKVTCRLAKELKAPVKKGQKVGEIRYTLDDRLIYAFPVTAGADVEKLDFGWCMDEVFQRFFHEKP